MGITSVKITLNESNKHIKGFASVMLNNSMLLRGIAITEHNSELNVILPKKKRKGREYFHPINRETREALKEKVLEAYHVVLESSEKDRVKWNQEETLSKINSVSVHLIEDDPLVKALITIVVNDEIAFNQIRVIERNGELELVWPAKQKERADVSYYFLDFFRPTNEEMKDKVTKAVLKEYNRVSCVK